MRLFARFLILVLMNIYLLGCNGKVDQAKNMIWVGDKSLSIGKALDNYSYFEKTKWIAKTTANGKDLVEFTGTLEPSLLINIIDDKLSSITLNITKIQNEIDEKSAKFENNDMATVLYYTFACFDMSEEDRNECVSSRYDRVKDKRSTGKMSDEYWGEYVNLANYHFNRRKTRIDELKKEHLTYSDKLSSIKKGARIEIYYQFILNHDKSISISAAEYRHSDSGKVEDMNNYSTVLHNIYQNKPLLSIKDL